MCVWECVCVVWCSMEWCGMVWCGVVCVDATGGGGVITP